MSSTSTSSVLFETTALLCLRSIFFFACRHYVSLSLSSDLRSVIEEDDDVLELENTSLLLAEEGLSSLPGRSKSSGGGGGEVEGGNYYDDDDGSPTRAGGGKGKGRNVHSVELERIEGSTSGSSLPPTPTRSKTSSPVHSRHHPNTTTASGRRGVKPRQTNSLYSKLATSVFCVSFSESCMLFTLVLFGEVISDRSRSLNWSMSLLALLFLIVFFIPLGICLLLTHRSKQSDVSKTVLLTLVPFSIYLFLYYKVGSYIASKVVVEGAHSLGLINALLSRICVPGVILIASLSGGGAVNTAWEAFEWRSISSAEPVTDTQILAAERSLFRARMEISQRTRSLSLASASAAREATANASQSIFSRWTSSTPAATHLASLELELKSLDQMESQMMLDITVLRRRKQMREMGRSFKGRLWLVAGWALSVYCVWRVFISGINLIFGYSQRQHLPEGEEPDNRTRAGTDLVTSLLSRLTLLLDVDIDIAVWSRLIGLILIGSIILANMRNVLASVSRIFKATSSGISASFMLLFLAELMSIYLLTSLISLPTSPSESSTVLLNTLPAFNVFTRLFDSVFLLAAVSVLSVRWVSRKIGQEEGVSTTYT